MKFRVGFVSNSSTCSFVICGFLVPGSEKYGKEGSRMVLEKLFGITEKDVKNEMKTKPHWKDDVDDPEQVQEYFNEMFWDRAGKNDKIGIVHGEGAPNDGIIVGRSMIHGGSEDFYIEDTEYDLEELMKEVIPLREKMGCTDVPIKLYTGTLNC